MTYAERAHWLLNNSYRWRYLLLALFAQWVGFFTYLIINHFPSNWYLTTTAIASTVVGQTALLLLLEMEPKFLLAEIDPNVRVKHNWTFTDFEDVYGVPAVGDKVMVFERESGLIGRGRVREVDTAKRLVYISVNWSKLKGRYDG